jgi:hypothetical protein
MPEARPLRDVFTDLTGEGAETLGPDARPEEMLRAQGHEELGDDLVAEAVVNFADSAPIEVAEHLARFVMAHSPVPLVDPSTAIDGLPNWLDLLTSAPAEGIAEIGNDGSAGLDGLDGASIGGAADSGVEAIGSAHDGFDVDHGLFLDFGYGEADQIGASELDGDAEIGMAGGPGEDELDADRDLGLTVYDGHLAALDGLDASVGDAQDDGDDADPADTIDA